MVGRILLGVGLLVVTSVAQQPNTPGASLVIAGESSDTYPLDARLRRRKGTWIRFEVKGAPHQGFLIGRAPAGTALVGLETDFGLMDLDTLDGFEVMVDGIGKSTGGQLDYHARTDANGRWSHAVQVRFDKPRDLGGFQALVGDPTSPTGYTLTAATHLTVTTTWRPAIYVAAQRGRPGADGSRERPYMTITEAMQTAAAMGRPFPVVYVAAGDYRESPTFPAGLKVLGGYHATTWRRAPSWRSRVFVGATPAAAVDVQEETLISRLEFFADDVRRHGEASMAFMAIGCGDLLRFEECAFVSGAGGPGRGGDCGRAGRAGSSGGFGRGEGSTRGGAGGKGGEVGTGEKGRAAVGGAAGGRGGFTALCTTGNADGEPGMDGQPGQGGEPGRGAAAGGVVAEYGMWRPGPPGASGEDGHDATGGGGGGGGASTIAVPHVCKGCPGGRGGGGGEGGHGGEGGDGGHNGGASIAVFCFYSGPRFTDCLFQPGPGGRGGIGGRGGRGGWGGVGGRGADRGGGRGGEGGFGGNGGGAGGGGGGAGGPSYGILVAGDVEPILRDSTLVPSAGGRGGSGGLHGAGSGRADPGADGPEATVINIPLDH